MGRAPAMLQAHARSLLALGRGSCSGGVLSQAALLGVAPAHWSAHGSSSGGSSQGFGGCAQLGALLAFRQQQQLLLRPPHSFAAHYAKGRGGKKGGKGRGHHGGGDDDEGQEAAAAGEGEGGGGDDDGFDLEPTERLMQQAVEHFAHELSGVRTGRANPGLIENLLVEAHGEKLPVKACGTVTARNPQLLAVALFDPELAKAVEKAIRDSPLSLNPTSDGAEVLVRLPRMTKDTIEKMVKLVALEAEGAHQSVRRARQKGMDAIKKAFKAASADERKRVEKQLQKLHDQYVAEVERLTKTKDAELREHRD